MNLSDNISPFPNTTPPSSPSASKTTHSPVPRTKLKLKRLSLVGGVSFSPRNENIEDQVKEAMDESTLHTPSTSSFDSSQTSRASSSTPVLLKGFPDQTHRTSLVRFLPPSSAPIPSPTTPTYSFQSVKRNRRRSTDLFSSVILEEPGDTVEPGSSGFERRKRASMYGTGTGIGREEGKGRERLTLLELHSDLLKSIAKQESLVHSTRLELEEYENQLSELRKEWEGILRHNAPISTTQVGYPSSSSSFLSLSNQTRPLTRPNPISRRPLTQREDLVENSSSIAEGGKKLLEQLIGGIGLGLGTGTGGPPRPNEDDRMGRERVERRTMGKDGSGVGINRVEGGGRDDQADADQDEDRRTEFDALGSHDARARYGSHSSIESSTSSMTTGAGAGANANANGTAGWVKKWDEVINNPQVQAGSKRASAFFSASLTDTYNLISQALPTPNLAALTASENGNGNTARDTAVRPVRRVKKEESVGSERAVVGDLIRVDEEWGNGDEVKSTGTTNTNMNTDLMGDWNW